MNAHIYLVTNAINDKQYVGQTITDGNIRGHGRLMRAAYKKYGFESFEYVKIATGIYTRNALNYMERFWIATFNTAIPSGYNLETGGSENQEWTDERRKKHSAARVGRKLNRPLGSKSGMKGKKYPEEGKRKLSLALKGKRCPTKGIPHTKETKLKMSESQRKHWASLETHPNVGKKHSEETKAKMSASRTGRKQSDEERKMRSESIKQWHKSRKEQVCQ
jgi:group I intron endonuclease